MHVNKKCALYSAYGLGRAARRVPCLHIAHPHIPKPGKRLINGQKFLVITGTFIMPQTLADSEIAAKALIIYSGKGDSNDNVQMYSLCDFQADGRKSVKRSG